MPGDPFRYLAIVKPPANEARADGDQATFSHLAERLALLLGADAEILRTAPHILLRYRTSKTRQVGKLSTDAELAAVLLSIARSAQPS